ncbi:MAG: PKD domain-containing protein, partial [Deltaproteobacteria bacterium]|nr:PKD domain-containing protein [Deltaproteobacteria bacterium]
MQNPGHAYSLAGTFTVTLKAGNAQGSSTVSKPLIVKIAPPTAGISFSPSLPYTGQAVTFTDTSTGKPTSWAWNFGDGSTSTSQNPTHTYSTAGTYTVTLIAGNAGGSSTFIHALTVGSTSGSLNYPTVIQARPNAT